MQPLLWAALAAAAGVAAAAQGLSLPFGLALAAGVLALGLQVWEQPRGAACAALVFCFLAGAGRAGAALAHADAPSSLAQTAAALQAGPRGKVFLSGYLRDAPDPLYENGRLGGVRLDLEAVGLARAPDDAAVTPVQGGVRLYGYAPSSDLGALLDLQAGQGVAAAVHLRPVREYRDPGVADIGAAARREGIAGTATLAAGAAGWRLWPVDHADWRTRTRARIWRWLGTRLDRLLPPRRQPRANALLRGMLLGDVARLDDATRTAFQADGVYHLLVVAGLHIGVLAFFLNWLLRQMRIPRLPAALLALLLLAAYAWIIAGRTPTVRALLMLTVYCGARQWHRERQALNAVGAAALVLLAWRPLDLFAAGFQLSLGAALLLAGVALPLLRGTSQAWKPGAGRPLRAAIFLYEVFAISAVLQVGFAGFQAVYFHRFSPWAVLANLVLVSAAGVLIPVAWVGLALGGLAGPVAAVAVSGLARFVLWTATAMAGWPGAGTRTPSPPGWFLVAFALGMGLWLLACGRGGRAGRRAATALALALAAIAVWEPFAARLPPGLTATMLDVGQGDAIFVTFPDRRTLLVDGGPRSPHWDSGSEVVAPYLWSLGLRHIDAVVLTHAHMDHMGGLPAVVAAFHPEEIWLTRTMPTDAATASFLALARASGAHLRRLAAGDAFVAGASRLEVLLPPPAYQAGELASNDDSMALRVHWGPDSMLLEGDAEAGGEHWMLEHHLDLGSELLKVGHHGSRTSSTPAFLAAVHPRVAVISVGAGNEYGHPSPVTLAALAAAGARVFRTDRDGAVQCRLEGSRLAVYLFRPAPGG